MFSYFLKIWPFTLLWLVASFTIIQTGVDALKSGKWLARALAFASIITFILMPIDRYKSDVGLDREIERLKQENKLVIDLTSSQAKALEVLNAKNKAQEKLVTILEAKQRQIGRIGINIQVIFSIAGYHQLPNDKLIPGISPEYAKLKGDKEAISFQAQDGSYNLYILSFGNNLTTYRFQTNAEVLNAGFPVGQKIDILKSYYAFYVFVPFIVKDMLLSAPSRQVTVKSVEIFMTINGKHLDTPIRSGGADALVGKDQHYLDQSFWFQIPIFLKTNLFKKLKLEQF